MTQSACDISIASCENSGAAVKYLLKKATEVQLTIG